MNKQNLKLYDQIKEYQTTAQAQATTLGGLVGNFSKLDTLLVINALSLELQEKNAQLMEMEHEQNQTRNRKKRKELSNKIWATQQRMNALRQQAMEFTLIDN